MFGSSSALKADLREQRKMFKSQKKDEAKVLAKRNKDQSNLVLGMMDIMGFPSIKPTSDVFGLGFTEIYLVGGGRLQFNYLTKAKSVYTVHDIQVEEVQFSKGKNKKGLGRAIGGGILFGGVGAVVGAATGTTSTHSKSTTKYSVQLHIHGKTVPKFYVNGNDLDDLNEIIASVKGEI